jgi:hypothetical protein
MSGDYKVIINGPKSGMDRGEVVIALARLFKKPPDLLDKKLQQAPWVVKTGLTQSEAEKYKNVLEKAGTACSIEQEAATLSMEMEDQPETTERKPIRTCPKCGYETFDEKDPLVKAFDGEGECPNCGILVSRYLQKTSPEAEINVEPSAVSVQAASSSGKTRNIIIIAAAVVVAVVLVWYFMGGEETPPQKPASKPAATTAKTAGIPDAPAPVQCVINPGNPQTIALSGLAPFFHESHQTGEIEPIMRISQNPWKDRGVEVKVSSVKLTPFQVELWELGYGGGNYKLPDIPQEEIKVGGTSASSASPKGFLSSLKYTEHLLKLIEFGQLPESEFEELVSDQKHAELRKSTYTAYEMDINLTFSAPDGVQDFTSEMMSRGGDIWVMLTGVLTKDGRETGAVDYQYGMKLRGLQKAGENSMNVELPEDSEYMLYNFSIDCR